MSRLFLDIFNLSITASWLIAAVILIRLALKNHAPKWTMCLLWAIVALRLVIPFSFESGIGLIPSDEPIKPDAVFTETVTPDKTPADDDVNNDQASDSTLQKPTMTIPYPSEKEEAAEDVEYVEFGIGTVDDKINSALNTDENANSESDSNPLRTLTEAASVVWVVGIGAMLLYAVVNYLLLRRRVAESIPDGEVRRCDSVGSPFILGLFRPRIYLPFGLSKDVEEQVVAHEKAHIKRCDHLIKPFGYLILTVYWFNPLVWVAYILLCRDIELACDERVIKNMNSEARKAYASALLECGIKRNSIAACPVAFGEVSVKSRVKNAINYKKPMFWVIIAAIVACVGLLIFFITQPSDTQDVSEDSSDVSESVVSDDSVGSDGEPSADSSSESTSDTSETEDATEIDFDGICIEFCYPTYDTGDTNTNVFMARDFDELKAIGKKVDGKNFADYIDSLPDGFFDEKVLFMTCIGDSSACKFSIKGIEKTETKLNMTVEVFYPVEITTDINYRMIIAEIDKNVIDEDMHFSVTVETVYSDDAETTPDESSDSDESFDESEVINDSSEENEASKAPDDSSSAESTGGADTSDNEDDESSSDAENTANTSTKLVPFNEYIVEDHVVYDKLSDFKAKYGDVCVIKSASELEVLKGYFKYPVPIKSEFTDFANSIPDGFFNENMLLITTSELPTLGYDIDIVNITAGKNGVTLKYTYAAHPGEAVDAVQENVIIAAVNKSALAGYSKYRVERFETHRYNVSGTDIAFTPHYFVANNLDAYDNYEYKAEKVRLSQIKSYMDLQGFLATHSESDLGEEFYSFASKLDHDYFEKKSLLIASVSSISGSNTYKIDGLHVYPQYGYPVMKIARNTYGLTDDMLYLLLVAEVNFDDLFGMPVTTAVANVGFGTGYDEWQAVQKAQIMLDKKQIDGYTYAAIDVINRRSHIPFMAVIKATGADIVWQSDTKATASLGGATFVIDMAAKTVTDAETGKNVFDTYSIGLEPEFCEVMHGDLYFDGEYIMFFLSKYAGVKYSLDYEEFYIVLTSK